jgi:5-methylcytosine-specific restriction endonuclease McrA
MKRGGRLAPMSDKRADEAEEREAVCRAVWMRDRGECQARTLVPEVRCWGPMDVDEICPRSACPGGHLDVDNCQVLCRGHHDWKHAHPIEAAALGLRRWSWE